MPLNKPAIPDPARLDLPRVQQVIGNIRERFRNVEAYLLTVEAALTGARLTIASGATSVQRELDDLDRRLRELEGDTEPFTQRMSAGETIAVGDPVRVTADGVVALIDPDSATESSAFYGIAASAATEGDEIDIRLPGGVVEVSGAAFTPGLQLFAAVGGVTHSPSGRRVPVGVAISATQIVVGYGFREQEASTSGGVLPVVTGEVPPVLVYLPDGNLVYVEID
jgi:hypothetical protein